jgi:beta-mannosidase
MRGRCSLYFLIFLFLMGCKTRSDEALIQITLNSGWKFKCTTDKSWHSSAVPGDILSAYSRLKGWRDRWFLNSRQIEEVMGKSWEYSTDVNISADVFAKDSISLFLPLIGACTKVFINNVEVSKGSITDGGCNISCKRYLSEGKNNFRVVFNPTDEMMAFKDSLQLTRPEKAGDLVSGNALQFLFQRLNSLPYSKIVSVPGFSEEPYLTAWSNAKIDNVYFYPLTISEKTAQYNAEISIMASKETEMNLEISIDKKSIVKLYELKLKPGVNRQIISFNIANPKLWWANGLGTQHLYDVTFKLFSGTQVAHKVTYPLGVRKLDISFEKDSINQPLRLLLNGTPVLLKGGLVELPSNLEPASIESLYKRIIENAKDANINILRLSRTDFYKPELFYNLCNENGLLVWQDIAVPNFLNQKTQADAEYAVERAVKHLRNMPCCAIYMGKPNNCGEFNIKSPECTMILNKKLPAIIRKYDYQTFYSAMINPQQQNGTVNSNNGTNFVLSNALYSCNSALSFAQWADSVGFSSRQIQFLLDSSIDINGLAAINDRFALHLSEVSRVYPNPHNIRAAFYLSQLLQAGKMKQLMRSYHLNNNGPFDVINLPLFDSRPASFGTITDFWGNNKPAYYELKNAYEGVVVMAQLNGNFVDIFAINTEMKGLDAILLCKVIDFSGNGNFVKQIPVAVNANSKVQLLSLPVADLLTNVTSSKVALMVQLNQPGHTTAQDLFYFVNPRQLDLPRANIKIDINVSGRGYNVILKSDVLAKNVFLEVDKAGTRFSDNNIDILPGKRYKVFVLYNGSRDELSKNLVITCLNNLK